MTSESTVGSETTPGPASGDDIQIVEADPPGAMAGRSPRSGFGDLFPSIFSNRWPDVFAGASSLEPMKLEEELATAAM